MKQHKGILAFFALIFLTQLNGFAQQPSLLIQRFFTNPSGTDAPNEFVELVATRTVDFNTEPHSVIFMDGSNAGSNGWASGGSGSYAFNITAGLVHAGEIVYVGGVGLSAYISGGTTCTILRQINTLTTPGDDLGNASNAALGNGGSTADGIAVFNSVASTITSSSQPIDAIFFGSAVGSAANKFTTPLNDLYQGTLFGSNGNIFLAPDPSSDEYVFVQTGSFNNQIFSWITPRTWSKNTIKPLCSNPSPISFNNNSASFSIAFNHDSTSAYLHPPFVSAVIDDPTDPAKQLGIWVSIQDNGLPLAALNYQFTASSSNTSIVSNDSISIQKLNGNTLIKISPTGVGYCTIVLTATNSNNQQKSLQLYYAASAPSQFQETIWHTGISDASDAIVLDSNYFATADDELNLINIYSRHQSGLALKSYNYSAFLNLPDGPLEEVDVEAATRSSLNPNKIYWIGSMSNGKAPNFNYKPNRNCLFATSIAGSGIETTFTFSGNFNNLRTQLISWGNNYGYNFSASAAEGVDAKAISGFAIEGMAFGPDKTTLYIAFRAPLVPINSRNNAIIAPITNFESWFNNGNPTTPATFAAPIELSLGGRGIRDLIQLSNGAYIIVAGNSEGSPITSALFMWTGRLADAPVALTCNVSNVLNLEAVMEIQENGMIHGSELQLITDCGSDVYYNDNKEAKDLVENNYKKFRTDKVRFIGNWNYVFTGSGNWDIPQNWLNGITPPVNLPAPQQITINNQPQGNCLLNVLRQTIASGAKIIIATGASFIIPGELKIN